MTALLEKAIQETQTLSEAEQDFVAALLIENIQDARQWDTQFAASQDVLEEMYDEAMEAYQAGRTTPLTA